MRVLATSDLHGTLPKIEPCDLLIVAGDVCPDYVKASEVRQAAWLDTEFRDWLHAIPAKSVIGIAGNHDFVFEKPSLIPPDLPWIYLRDESVWWEDLVIYGTPWVPNLRNWAFYASDEAIELAYEAVPDETDIVVSHGPPYLHLDVCGPKFGGMSVGAQAANRMIDRVKPKLFVCGHIHESHGMEMRGDTVICNVSLKDDDYRVVHPVIDVTEYLESAWKN